nr:unnamed protein product [Spirometra erinaceieuropaei]
MSLRLPHLEDRFANIIRAYAPSMTIPDELRNKFYEDLHALLASMPRQRLISGEHLGDRKPTKLLRRLQQLSDGHNLDATMFKQLFLQRLPSSVQVILEPKSPSSTVQMLAETADRMLEYKQPSVTANVASRTPAVSTAPTIEDVMKRLDDLTT